MKRIKDSSEGELEVTISCAYSCSANLHSILHHSGCPEVIKHVEGIFQKLVNPQVHNSLQTDIQTLESIISADDDSKVPIAEGSSYAPADDLRGAFQDANIPIPPTTQFLPHVSICGLIYTPFLKHKGNACIMTKESVPAQIQHVVKTSSATYLAVHHHKPSHCHYDPYSKYSLL